jgi:hypothetical protein
VLYSPPGCVDGKALLCIHVVARLRATVVLEDDGGWATVGRGGCVADFYGAVLDVADNVVVDVDRVGEGEEGGDGEKDEGGEMHGWLLPRERGEV